MQVQLSAKALKDVLALVAKAAPSRPRLPVLDCALIEATADNLITVTATDLEMFIRYQVPAQVQTAGAATVPIKALADWIRPTAPGEQITLTLDGVTVQCAGGSRQMALAGEPAPDFPTLALPDPAPFVSVPVAVLREMVPQVLFAAAQDGTRPVMAGILMICEGRTLTLVAGDGHRLSIRRAECLRQGSAQAERINIPGKAIRELMRVLAVAKEGCVQVHRHTATGAIFFTVGAITLGTRQLDRFPNWEPAIPSHAETQSLAPTAALLQAVESVKPGRNDLHLVSLTLTPTEATTPGSVTVESKIAGTEIKTTRQIRAHVTGPGGVVAFNGRYLREVLQAMPTAQIEIRTDRNGQGGMFCPTHSAETLHIIMPMQPKAA